MSGATPLLSLYAFRAWIRKALAFYDNINPSLTCSMNATLISS
jgi:hypothetical protein